ncbi:MAG: hypothetical protein K9G48_08590 [Reyranella sp.]|nr:hypothetical protein [Reyranella sp.]
MARGKTPAIGMVEVEILADFSAGPRGRTAYSEGQRPNPVVSVEDADSWQAKGLARRVDAQPGTADEYEA